MTGGFFSPIVSSRRDETTLDTMEAHMNNTQKPATRPDRLLREREVLNILPIGRASLWAGVKSGRYPQPVKLGPRTTCWRESEIIRLIEMGTEG